MKDPERNEELLRDWKGIWIPKELWLNKELTIMEKILFIEIQSLDNEFGCIASNSYFSDFIGLSQSRISELITALIEKKYIISLIEKTLELSGWKSHRVLKINNERNYPSENRRHISENRIKYSENQNRGSEKTKYNNILNNINNIYGQFKNIKLKDSDYKKLIDELGEEKTKSLIDWFSYKKEMCGYKYKSDYLAIKKWVLTAWAKENNIIIIDNEKRSSLVARGRDAYKTLKDNPNLKELDIMYYTIRSMLKLNQDEIKIFNEIKIEELTDGTGQSVL